VYNKKKELYVFKITLFLLILYIGAFGKIYNYKCSSCISKCCDGTWSTSSGKGTCSSHGGVCSSSSTIVNEVKNTKITYSIKRVIDGDTVAFNGFTCRLFGIDTPETYTSTKLTSDSKMCNITKETMVNLGKQSTEFVESLTTYSNGYEIVVSGEDSYGRKICDITLPNGTNLNQKIVQSGYAVVYEEYISNSLTKQSYLNKETLAKENKLGLWSENYNIMSCLAKDNISKSLEIFEGWNLVSLPVSINNMQTSIFNDYKSIWIYNNNSGVWTKNPNSLSYTNAFWINSNIHKTYFFDGNVYSADLSNINSSEWLLFSTAEIIFEDEYSNISKIFVWNNELNDWSINPKYIQGTKGFWLKK
jgi:endonuclease YncB( thermonuclease family)